MKHYPQLAEGIMADLWRDFWIRETGTGQQVAQLHDIYDDDDDDSRIFRKSVEKIEVWLKSDKHYGYFKWGPLYIYDNISQSLS